MSPKQPIQSAGVGMLSPRGLGGHGAKSILGMNQLAIEQQQRRRHFEFQPDIVGVHPKTPTQKPALPAALGPSPSMASAAPPSAQDLFELYKLCGGNRLEVMQLLARAWGTSPQEIEPTVSAWLDQLPVPLPPSRSTSAPPQLSGALATGPRLLLDAGDAAKRAMAAKITRTPAASAPPNQRSSEVRLAAIHGLNSASTRLNASVSHRSPYRSGALPPAQILSLPQPASFAPVVFTPAEVDAVPEEEPVEFWDDGAPGGARGGDPAAKPAGLRVSNTADHPLANVFVARQAALNSKLKPTEPLRGGSTRMRG